MKHLCSICHHIYDEDKEGISFALSADSFKCPVCGASKSFFSEIPDNWNCPSSKVDRALLKKDLKKQGHHR